MRRADAERPDADALDPLGAEGVLDRSRLLRLAEPTRPEHDDPRLGQTPQREADRTRRRSVEPLEVVDREHEPVLGEHLERAADGDAEGALVDGLPGRVLHEQRDFERVPARRRQPRQHLVEDALEEVAEPGVREATLRLGRA